MIFMKTCALSPAAKRVVCSLLVALPLLLNGSSSVHADKATSCSFIGSWFGYAAGMMSWMSTNSGQNSSYGVSILEIPSFDATLGGTFAADKMTNARGFWKRLDSNSFAITGIAMAIDVDGQTIWVAKLSAVDTLAADCNSMWVESSLEIYLPWQNPIEEESFFDPITAPGHAGYRISAD